MALSSGVMDNMSLPRRRITGRGINHGSIPIERKGVEVLRRLRALAQKDRQHEVAPHACRAPIPSVSRSSDDGAATPGAYRKPAVRCSLKMARSEYAPSFLVRDTHAEPNF